MTRALRIGLLGAARITPRALIAPARELGHTVVAVAARDYGRAIAFAEAHQIEHVAPTYEALLARDDLDLVYNALPTAWHAQWCIAALEAGKHVLCEKPFAMSLQEAQQVLARAAKQDRRVIEATHYRYHPMTERARTLLAEGEIGAVRSIEAHFHVPVRADPSEFRRDAGLGGGAFRDLGFYPLHLARTLLAGEPEHAICQEIVWEKPGVDLVLRVSMPFSATSVVLEAGMRLDRAASAQAVVTGDRGVLHLSNFVAPHMGGTLRIETAGGTEVEMADPRATFSFQMEAVANALQSGASALTEGSDITQQMRAMDLAYQAACAA
jgi:predicted dehydrogenase